jgi:hypothetical protein
VLSTAGKNQGTPSLFNNILAFNASGSKSIPDSTTGNAQGDGDAPAGDKAWWKMW